MDVQKLRELQQPQGHESDSAPASLMTRTSLHPSSINTPEKAAPALFLTPILCWNLSIPRLWSNHWLCAGLTLTSVLAPQDVIPWNNSGWDKRSPVPVAAKLLALGVELALV